MNKTISINNQAVALKEYNGNRVVTFKDIDTVHGRPEGTARRNFNSNKEHFVEGNDYFKICANEIRTHNIMPISSKTREDVTLITESGYLMLVKSFTDKLAWKVQRELVNCYFRDKTIEPFVPQLNEPPYEYFDKTFNGVPVLTIKDIAYFTGITREIIFNCIKGTLTENVDYYNLKGMQIPLYKRENPKENRHFSHLYVITNSGFKKICKFFKVNMEPLGCLKSNVEQPTVMEHPTMKEILDKAEKEKVYALPFDSVRFQNTIKMVNEQISALTVLLNKVNRHNIEISEFNSIRETIDMLGMDIRSDLHYLRYDKVSTTNKLKL